MFAAGFSYRLVALQRVKQVRTPKMFALPGPQFHLLLFSLVMYGAKDIAKAKAWSISRPPGSGIASAGC